MNLSKFALSFCFALLISFTAAVLAGPWEEFSSDPRPSAAAEARSGQAAFYVSPLGSDDWSGTLAEPNADKSDGPFKTFDKAKTALREFRKKPVSGPTRVIVRGGLYELTEPFRLDKNDSGTADSPIIWAAAAGETVRLSGGRSLSGVKPVTNQAVLDQFRPEVRGKIVEIDLKALGISDFGTPNGNWAELFCDNEPQTLARYPNDGFIKITGLTLEGTKTVNIRGTKGIAEGNFQFEDEGPLRWSREKEPWVNGYWFWDWSNGRQKIDSIDAATKTMKLAPPNHSYGYRIGQWFYAYNLLCEIDVPGEYYIDRETATLYFYPPEGKSLDGTLLLTMIPNIITLKDVANVTFSGFLLEGSRDTALTVAGGRNDAFCGLTIRNAGGNALSGGGTEQLVFGCHAYNLGRGGISVSGGDRKKLVSGQNKIVNNKIHHYGRIQRMYASGIHFDGVGHYIARNEISDAPHCAILFGGNDHLIELNKIERVCLESNDAGAIYSGRNWTMRGNCVKNNFLKDIDGFEHRGCVGVYLDDMFSSCDMIGNLFVRVTRAAFIGGGRDNSIVGNIFIDCRPSLHIDARALGWCADHADGWLKEAAEKGTMSGIEWNKPPYSERYPALAKILDGEPKAPEGNYIAMNICVGGTWDVNKQGQWQGDSVEKKALPYLKFENNFVGDDPHFVDAANGDYRLRPDAPALKAGFEQLPFELMGRYSDPAAAE